MEKAYKIRIYPNKKQEILIQKTFGSARYVYNHFLALKIELYDKDKTSLSYNDCSKRLTILKTENEWLKEVDKCSLQNSLKDLDKAYKNFFREIKKGNKQGFQKFKSKRKSKKVYRTNSNIKLYDGYIQLPKLGKVKFRDKYNFKGRILNATVSQSKSGKYFVSICCTDVDIERKEFTNKNIGIDVGIKHFATLSDKTKIENPRCLNKSLEKIKRLHKELSRKTKGGSNWNKTRVKLARAYEKTANQRQDFLNKLTTDLITNYDVICIEDLKVSSMLKDSNLARDISDVSWYEFKRQLEYKALWYGKKISKVDTYYPSSQICSVCGYRNSEVKNLNIREWTCSECSSILDRDINASINILNEGLRLLA